jgi:hypothetical protein
MLQIEETADARDRYIAAVIAGVLLHVFFFFQFASYSKRGEVHWLIFAVASLFAGFLVARISRLHPFRACLVLLATVCAAQLLLIVADVVLTDPTAHNLAPFEFLAILFFGSASFAGAATARLAAD